jgi:hypothetical protein
MRRATRMEEISAHKILIEKPERKRPFGIPMRRWEDNVRIYLR